MSTPVATVGPPYHNVNETLMGSIESSDKVVSSHEAAPASFEAGLVVSSNAGAIELGHTNGARLGVSMGSSLSDINRLAVARSGLRVPIRLKDESVKATGLVTITSYANLVDAGDDIVTVAGVPFVAQAGAATPGEATFQAATSDEDTAASLVAQINAHATTAALVIAVQGEGADDDEVQIEALLAGEEGNDISLLYSDEGTSTIGATVSGSGTLTNGADPYPYVELGAVVKTDATTGEASSDGSASAAVYRSLAMTGIYADGSTETVAMIDMQGGL